MPLWVRVAAWGALAALVLAGLHWWTSSIEARGYERGRGEVQKAWDRADLARTRATLRQSEIHREEENRRDAEKAKVSRDAAETLRLARADAVAADRAADGLRDQLAVFVASARSRADVPADPGAAARGQAAAADIALLSDLLRESESRAGSLAAALDASRAAGRAAERSYDSLMSPTNQPTGH